MSRLDPIDLLERLVAIDSQNPGPGEAKIARFVADLATSLGFETETFEAAPGRTNLIVTADAGPGPAIGLSGHLDTKPVGQARDEWRTPPLELTVEDDVGYGLGTSDMKGAVAAMIAASQRWATTADRGRLCLILTADEEAGSNLGSHALAASGILDVEAIVIGEPSGVEKPWESMFLVSRGISCFDVEIQGTQGHSGLSESLPTSATVAAAGALLALHRLTPTHPPNDVYHYAPTVNAGVQIEGGVFYGVHPGHARVACDVRLVPGMTREQLTHDIEAALTASLPRDVDWSVRYRSDQLGWMPAVEIAPDHPIVVAAQSACQTVLGRPLPFAAYPGGTDATPFFTRAGIPCIASLGPGWLSVAHGPNERVGLDQVREAVDLYTSLVRAYVGGERQDLPSRTDGGPPV